MTGMMTGVDVIHWTIIATVVGLVSWILFPPKPETICRWRKHKWVLVKVISWGRGTETVYQTTFRCRRCKHWQQVTLPDDLEEEDDLL